MSDDGKTVSTARVVELEMQVVSCRAAKERAAELEAGLRGFCAAQGRMLDRWGDADDSLRRELWRDLHAVGDAARRLLGEG